MQEILIQFLNKISINIFLHKMRIFLSINNVWFAGVADQQRMTRRYTNWIVILWCYKVTILQVAMFQLSLNLILEISWKILENFQML